MLSILGYTVTETYLVQTHFRKTETIENHLHQNTSILVSRTQVKTLGYGFHVQHRNLITIQSKDLRMIVDEPWYVPNTVIRRDFQTPTGKKKSAATALNSMPASGHTQTIY
jgi:hypothetical protein